MVLASWIRQCVVAASWSVVVLLVVLVVVLAGRPRLTTVGDSATAAKCFSPPPCPASAP